MGLSLDETGLITWTPDPAVNPNPLTTASYDAALVNNTAASFLFAMQVLARCCRRRANIYVQVTVYMAGTNVYTTLDFLMKLVRG